MERLPTADSRTLFAGASQIIGHALRLSPEETLQEVAKWRFLNGDSGVHTAKIVADLTEESLYAETGKSTARFQGFLSAGMINIGQFTDTITSQHPDLESERVVEIMSHPHTIRAIARLALQPGKELSNYVCATLEKTGTLTPNLAYVIEDDNLTVKSEGCPAAGHRKTFLHDGEVDPLPIFQRFVPWAAKVHLLSEDRRPFRELSGRLTLEK